MSRLHRFIASAFLLGIIGCSTHPLTDVLDVVYPGRVAKGTVQPFGGVCLPQGPVQPPGPVPAAVPAIPVPGTPSPAVVVPPPAPLPPPSGVVPPPPNFPGF